MYILTFHIWNISHEWTSSLFCIVTNMPEILLGAHTLQSHGVKLARVHMHDWLILLLLMVIDGILNIIEPFHRFIGQDMMTDLTYPFKHDTIPFWAVPVCIVILRIWIYTSLVIILVCSRTYELKKWIFLFPATDSCCIVAFGCIFCVLLL